MGLIYADDDEQLLFNYYHPKVEKVLSLFGFDDVVECGGLHPFQIWAESKEQTLLFYFNARYYIWGVIADEYYISDDDDTYKDIHWFNAKSKVFQITQDDGKYYGDIDDDLVCQWIYCFMHEFQNSQ